jgi:hypothetical protein
MKTITRHRLAAHLFALALFGLGLGSATIIHADTLNVTIPNFSFELPASASDTSQVDYHNTPTRDFNIEDWNLTTKSNDSAYGTINYGTTTTGITGGTGSQGVFIYPYYQYQSVSLTTGNTVSNDGSTAGATGYVTTVIANTTYTLDVNLAAPAAEQNSYGGYVSLNLIDSLGNTFASTIVNYSTLTSALTTEQLQFTSGAAPGDLGDGLKIQLTDVANADATNPNETVFDNVRLTESGPNIVVPEPSTYALFGLGLGFLVFGRRFSRSRSVLHD